MTINAISCSSHLVATAGKDSRADFQDYLRNGSVQRQYTMTDVLEEVHSEWTIEFLTPMLTDT